MSPCPSKIHTCLFIFFLGFNEESKMDPLVLQKGCYVWVFVLCFNFIFVKANATIEGTVFIDGKSPIAKTDEDFICATLDWWPPEKCDCGTCSWGQASLLNLDLKNIVFLNAIKAFSPLKIRLGGILQNQVIYQTEDNPQPCVPFAVNSSQMFGFTEGCLPLARWDELNSFFNQSGALIIFGLNALSGKSIQANHTATGPWNSTNAASLIHYTVRKGHNIYGWELGNELSGKGIGIGIAADPYASDTVVLHDLIQETFKEANIKPLTIAPGGLFDPDWYKQFLVKTAGSLNVITHHIYNIGHNIPCHGRDKHLVDKILNPSVLASEAGVFGNLRNVIKGSATSAVAWVGEGGGVPRSGCNNVTNTFVFSFWYLNNLGLASTYDTKTYCRQSLIGGNYGLLDTATYVPNPDYYSALLWHRLMGSYVLSTNFTGTKMISAYAHCAKQSRGITVLLINIDGNTTVRAKIAFNGTSMLLYKQRHYNRRSKTILFCDAEQADGTTREEYHLTPMDGNIQSQTVLLNGKALIVDASGAIPALEPVTVTSSEPINVAPYSIVFVHMPNVDIMACRLDRSGA